MNTVCPLSSHYGDVTWVLVLFKLLAHWLFVDSLFMLETKEKKSSSLLALCDGNPPVTGGFPSQRASNAKSVSKSWWHHARKKCCIGVAFGTELILRWKAVKCWRGFVLNGLGKRHWIQQWFKVWHFINNITCKERTTMYMIVIHDNVVR